MVVLHYSFDSKKILRPLPNPFLLGASRAVPRMKSKKNAHRLLMVVRKMNAVPFGPLNMITSHEQPVFSDMLSFSFSGIRPIGLILGAGPAGT
jgi:hypothetical protein